MSNQVTKRCHWVPQSYLRRFAADEKQLRVWRFSKRVGDPELKRIEKVAVKHHLYAPLGPDGKRNDALEKKLSDLEKWFGDPIWDTLCDGEVDLTWEPLRKMLALIIATMYVRNPLQFDRWKEMHSQFVEWLSTFDESPTHMTVGDVRREIDQDSWPAFRDADEEATKAAWNDYVAGAGDIAPKLLSMRYTMLTARRPLYITTDNPVAIVHPSGGFCGIADPETVVLLPLSPTRVLRLDHARDDPDGSYYEQAEDNPATLNMTLWRNSIDYMFSHRHPDEVLWEFDAEADRALEEA